MDPRDATVTFDGEAPCAEAACDRVTLVPAPGNDEFPCARHRLWYTTAGRVLRRAELYDPEDRLMTTIACDGYFAVDGHMTARACAIEHPRTGRRVTITVKEIAYDVGIGEDVFTVAHLSDGGR